MQQITTERGFQLVEHDDYPTGTGQTRLVGQSSVIGDYEDSAGRPGTSFLWIGPGHHLDREQVQRLRDYLTHWLVTGLLFDRPEG